MARRICIIQGHPDARAHHFCHALAAAYAAGASEAGHEVTTIDVGALEFPLLASREAWAEQSAPAAIAMAQRQIRDAEHLVIIFPLWLGDMPARLKGFLEQVMRPGFAVPHGPARPGAGLLKRRSARVVVTMGMPGIIYRTFFGAYALRLLKRNILHFVGIRPVRTTVIGMVDGSHAHRERALERMTRIGDSGR